MSIELSDKEYLLIRRALETYYYHEKSEDNLNNLISIDELEHKLIKNNFLNT